MSSSFIIYQWTKWNTKKLHWTNNELCRLKIQTLNSHNILKFYFLCLYLFKHFFLYLSEILIIWTAVFNRITCIVIIAWFANFSFFLAFFPFFNTKLSFLLLLYSSTIAMDTAFSVLLERCLKNFLKKMWLFFVTST